jgi:CHASE2 domain-containing sensor protein
MVLLIRYVLVGLIVTAILVVAKLYLEQTQFGHRLELLTYEFLHGQVAPFSREIETPVVVLDISTIPGGKGNVVTRRSALKEILQELVNQKPRAIAIDMDFSPGLNGWMDKDDPSFFQFCQKQQERGVPIVLGVFRTVSQKPDAWLGDEEFKNLAADMTIDARDTSRMRLWVQYGEVQPLPSISSALVKKEGIPLMPPPRWLRLFLQERVQVVKDPNEQFTSGLVLVNYSKLEALQSESLSTVSKQSIADLGQRFHNKFVIVGDASDSTDTFLVPGRFVPVPGVYLHACNLYSLTVEPFFELKKSFRLAVDFLSAFLVLLSVAIIRWKRRNESFDWHSKQRRLIWWSAGLSILIGILAVRLLDVLWLDFFLGVFVLLLHPSVEKGLRRVLHLSVES